MASETQVNEAIARQYLLGNVDDSERERIEELIIVYPEIKQMVLIVEEDLIDEYLEGSLSPTDKERFLAQYASTLPLRRKLEIANVIQRRAVIESKANQSPQSARQQFGNFVSSLGLRKRTLIPATAVAVALVVVSIGLIALNSRRVQDRQRRHSIERQLAQLNSPAELQNNPPGMLAVVLSPGTSRSASTQPEVPAGSNTTIVELQLFWTHAGEYDSHQAIIHWVSSGEKYTIPGLHLHKTARGPVIRLRLPSELLARGQYQITLSSVAKDGTPGPVEEYTFVAGR